MVWDLNFDVQIIGVPTVREFDGLALSSRNRYLDEGQRAAAVALSAALIAGAHAASGGAEAILETARAVLAAVPEIEVDYLEVRGVDLGPAPERGDGRLLVAAKLGTTRLIDNVGVAVGTGFLERDTDPSADAIDDLLSH
jgi:pantoate--beta-alanine ligase